MELGAEKLRSARKRWNFRLIQLADGRNDCVDLDLSRRIVSFCHCRGPALAGFVEAGRHKRSSETDVFPKAKPVDGVLEIFLERVLRGITVGPIVIGKERIGIK